MSRISICVVIGLQQNLDDVLQEANEVAAAAKDSGLFDKVYELIGQEATAENIKSKLSDAVQDLRDNSLLVVFYAGHGYFESGFTWIKTAEAPIALQKEVFEHVKQLRQNDGTTRRNRLDFGFVFSCCRIADPDGLQQDRDTSPPDYRALDGDTIIELHACQPGSCVVDSVPLGFALAYYLRKKPADFQSMLQSVSTDVRYLSIDRIQPYTKGESNHTIVLHSGKTDSQNPIMGEAELRYFKDAFLLSNHIFEAIQQEMKAADPMQSYENVRGELAEMARLIAGMGKQVTNLQIQLSVLCQWPLAAMNATLEIWMREPQLSEYLAACDRDIKNWQLIRSTPREAFYSALRKVSSDGLRDLRSPAMCARVKQFLDQFVSSISVLFPGPEVEESSEQSSDVDGCSHDPEVHQTHLRIPDADAADFSERERAAVLDALYDMLKDMGIGNDAAFSILSGSLWIVISTSTPLADKQRSGLVAALNMYVKKCKSGKNGPTSACAWMFAKTVQLTNGALVPISVFNRVRLARDLQKKLQKRPTADASWSTWLDANGIKAVATAVYNSNEGRSVISERQVRLFHHGQELQGRELLRSAGDIQITVEKMWEELTWPAALEETMQKISQRQDAKEMPWARSKSFQDFALAVFGICSSPDAALSQLCIQGLQDVLQSDKFMDSCTNPLALLTEVLSYLLANDPDMAEPIEPMKEMPEMPPATQDPLEDDMAESKEELPPIRNPSEALECHPAHKELHAQLASFPLTQDSLLKAVIAFPSMIHLPIFPDFLNVLEALTRPVTTRGPSGGSSLQDEVDQEVAVMLKALPANIERLGCENALADFIAEWR